MDAWERAYKALVRAAQKTYDETEDMIEGRERRVAERAERLAEEAIGALLKAWRAHLEAKWLKPLW
jgi:hypothetical protein